MSTPKLIRVYSPPSKSQNNKQTCCSQQAPDKSSVDTLIMNQKTSQMQNYYSLLIQQVKRLSRDNDRMWKLLTETEEQHSQCNKMQKKLKQNLQCAQKQLSMVKDMYSVQKSNFQQSKSFFQKRQKQWQQIVSQLKKVIDDYQSTQSINLNRASQIFNQTTQMKSPKNLEKLNYLDKELSIYSKKNFNITGRNMNQEVTKRKMSIEKDLQESDHVLEMESNRGYQEEGSNIEASNIRYNYGQEKEKEYGESDSILSKDSKSNKHRSRLFKSKNFISKMSSANIKKTNPYLMLTQNKNVVQTNIQSHSANKIIKKSLNHNQQTARMQYFPHPQKKFISPNNPQNVYQLLSMQDIFQRALRRTYIKYRNEQNQRACDITNSQHMQKLKNAKSSTKQRMQKTIKKLFIYQSIQELDDIIKFIEEKVYKKYRLLKGELVFKYLEEKFKQCQQIFQSSNSALERFDQEPTNFINGITGMNSRFKEFESKKKESRQNMTYENLRMDSYSSGYNNYASSPSLKIGNNNISKGYGLDKPSYQREHSQAQSRNASNIGLSINSNIKDKNIYGISHTPSHHLNNHIASILPSSRHNQPSQLQRQNSKKNIYTQKRLSRLSRRNVVEQMNRTSNKSISSQASDMNKNLSSLIGASQEYDLMPVSRQYEMSNEFSSSKDNIRRMSGNQFMGYKVI